MKVAAASNFGLPILFSLEKIWFNFF